jgi:hypothetical protein
MENRKISGVIALDSCGAQNGLWTARLSMACYGSIRLKSEAAILG